MNTNEKIFYDALVKLGLDVLDVHELNVKDGNYRIQLKGPLTYAQLAAVSAVTETDRIDLDSEAEESCPTCSGAESWVMLTVYGAK